MGSLLKPSVIVVTTWFSVFRSELIAISGALDNALNSYKDSIWILRDSRSSIQYLKNWQKIMHSTGLDILSKLVSLVRGNKFVSSGFHHMWVCLGTKLLMSWLCRSSRAHQTALARFRSGHLRSMTFVQEVKSFFTCPCSLLASPLLIFWTAGAFPCDSCMKSKGWCVLRGKVHEDYWIIAQRNRAHPKKVLRATNRSAGKQLPAHPAFTETKAYS
ncbi:uncharacterized protein TNCV_634191 [Trichonephila clavipes]|nr:uncharacterized protein TNCV_634191 [Trichonephila clavipes]